ncbi:MAG: FHA domain-containing protein [Anaerolineae bacterium]|nr:FHA domain-containing protein [Anaerolineae bacterium]
MKRLRPIKVVFYLFMLLLLALEIGAQGQGPVLRVLGEPSPGPNAEILVSVLDPNVGRSLPDLTADNFALQLSGEAIPLTGVTSETGGVAVVLVVDRGGIARKNDPRIGQAMDLSGALLDRLVVDGSPNADMVALVGIRGRDAGGLTPLIPFTDRDPNSIRNEFDALRAEVVPEVTPMYDGIDRAIEWLTQNPNAQVQAQLNSRRAVIVVFSDGIDRQFSSEAYETVIINKCLQSGILLYAVRMGGGATDEDNLQAMATQTHGRYAAHEPSNSEATLSLFDDLVTLRGAYRLRFPVIKPQGDYKVRVQVQGTVIGDAFTETTVASKLRTPRLSLNTPPETSITVPFSKTIDGFLERGVTLSVAMEFPDAETRNPDTVSYYANGALIGASSSAPDYPFEWQVSNLVTPTREIQSRDITFLARATDPYLDVEMASQPVNVRVTWEAEEVTVVEETKETVKQNWWIIVVLGFLLLGLLILLILLIKTRGEIARKVVAPAAGAISKMTQRLSAAGPAYGKLVVVHGSSVGQEYRLASPQVKVGRDAQNCDFPLFDQFISNPHFSIRQEQNQVFIVDEGSTNGTFLNGLQLRPSQPVPLQPDAIIKVGNTQLQFKRLGGETRRVSIEGQAPSGNAYSAGSVPPTQAAAGSSPYGPTVSADDVSADIPQMEGPPGGSPPGYGPTVRADDLPASGRPPNPWKPGL